MASFFQMVLHDALLHADLHDGNMLYSIERRNDEEESKERLVAHLHLLDFGIAVQLNDIQKEAIHQLIVGLYVLHLNYNNYLANDAQI